jgi:Ca2+/Na+ antiporter
MTQPTGSDGLPPSDALTPGSDNARLESLMAEVPPSTPGWSAPPSRTPTVALWLGVGAFVAAWAVVIDLALVRQGQRSILAGGILGSILLAGFIAAIAAIIGGIQVRSTKDSDAAARARAAIAIGLAAVALLLMTLAGLELYAIGLDAF